jgi:hypothetical protein
MKASVFLFFTLSLNAVVPICSFSSIVLSNSLNRVGTTLKAVTGTGTGTSAAQLLEFQEPQTNVTVILVGAMHYNPASIRLAKETIQDLGNQNKLGSVVVESCDIRWNKTAELYNEKPYLKTLLNNEMRTACDVAFSFDRPTVLGDQRINITSNALKASLKQTLIDLTTPPKGWKRFVDEVAGAWDETVPMGGKGYLNAFAFLDPRLLLVLPVSLVIYPLAFLVRDPLPTTVALSLLVALSYTDDPMTMQVLMNEEIPLSDWITTFVLSGLETAVFARLLLKPLLAERNKILARSILDQCKIYAGEKKSVRRGWFESFLRDSNNDIPTSAGDETELVYAPGSPVVQNSAAGADGKVVVAVLGMAHCNGIMKLLKEQKV